MDEVSKFNVNINLFDMLGIIFVWFVKLIVFFCYFFKCVFFE